VFGDMTGGLEISTHTVFVICQSYFAEVRIKLVVSSVQLVKLDPCLCMAHCILVES